MDRYFRFPLLFTIILFFSACTTETATPKEPRLLDTATMPPLAAATAENTPEPTITTKATLAPTETPQPTAPPTETAAPTFTAVPAPPLERDLFLQSPALQGEDVRQLQNWLKQLGFDPGVPDGIFGNLTDQAVRSFQSAQGLPVDGLINQEAWKLLFNLASASAQAANGTISSAAAPVFLNGDYEPEVKEIEERLQDLGYPICRADRNFSLQTAAAVQYFQQTNGLAADGVVGPVTWAALFAEDAQPFDPGREISASNLGEIGFADEISFDGKFLWVVRKTTIDKLDPNSGETLNSITFPDVGTTTYNNNTYPVHFIPGYTMPLNGDLWVAGRAAVATSSGQPVVRVFSPSGKALSEPIYFGQDDLVYVQSLLEFNGKIWAFLGESMGPPAFVELNGSGSQAGRRVPLLDAWGVTDAVAAPDQAWVAAFQDEDPMVRAVNPEIGALGAVLGPCGEELAFDGQWVWVNDRARVAAADPVSREIKAYADLDGYIYAMTSDGKGRLWLLVGSGGDTYLYVLSAGE